MGESAREKMVLADLGQKITGAIRKMSEAPVIDDDVLKDMLKEIAVALMQADVDMKLVKQLRDQIKNRINLEMLAAGYSKKRIVQAAVFEELVEMLTPANKPFVVTINTYTPILTHPSATVPRGTCPCLIFSVCFDRCH